MDREISQAERSKGSFRKLLPLLGIFLILVISYLGFRKVLSKTADRSDIRIATVERGDMQATLSAAGTVIAASERVINAPVATEIQEVLLRTGATVKPGDLILKLDQEYTALEYEKLQDELSLKKNNIDKLELQYDKDLRDLDFEDQIKALQLSELEAQLTDQKRLLQVGGATAEEVEAADLQLKIARLEKSKLANELQYRRNVNGTDKQNLQLEFNIQAKRLKELQRKLSETQVKSPDAGVITWINEDIGKTVAEGEPLVKIANLERYKIEGTTSDRNSEQLQVGMPVEVRIGQDKLKGEITRVLPEIVNNTVRFYVSLDEESNTALRPNMRTELYIITDNKTDVVKAKRGNALKGSQSQYVYKVEGNTAVRTRISKGLVSSDEFEIESGLSVGDKLIISDMKDYEHMETFEIVK